MQIGKFFTALQGMAIVGMLILTGACSGSGSNGAGNAGTTTPAGAVTVALIGVPADINVSATVPVTAQVKGTTDMAVTWTVDNIQNGNSDVGTIAGSGNTVTYTAPTTEGSYMLAATAASYALALLSYHGYEKHFLALKRYFPSGRPVRPPEPLST